MSQFLTFENLLLVLGGATALGIWAYRTWSKQSAETKLARILLLQSFCQTAYLAVHALASSTGTKVDDKIAEALKRVTETLAAQTGKPHPNFVRGGLKEGMVVMSPLNSVVPADAKKVFEEKKKAIAEGKFHPFQGPVVDQSGATKVAAGSVMPLDKLLSMDFYVKGVEGSIPK